MSLNDIPAGKKVPDEVNVIIEIPAHADPVKYEVDKDTGALSSTALWQLVCITQQTTAMYHKLCLKTVILLM